MPNPTLREYFKTHPEIADQWSTENEPEALDKTTGSPSKAWWYCPVYKCHYEKEIHGKINAPQSCSVCHGSTVFPGFNDLQTVRPDIAAEWSPENNLSPREVKYTSIKSVEWVCSRNKEHTWKTRISHRTHAESGCPKCKALEKREHAKSRIFDKDDEMSKMFKFSSVGDENPSRKSSYKCEWECENSHTWSVSPRYFDGCPFCKGTKTIFADEVFDVPNKSIANYPEAVKLYADTNPIPPHLISYNSAQIATWNCGKGHLWTAVVYSVVRNLEKGKKCCPKCANRISTPEEHLKDFILEITPNELVIGNRKLLDGREIDILIPSMNFGVEFNGGIWHSSFKVDKNYHFDKWFDCLIQNIELVTVWEDDWELKRPQVGHMLKNRLMMQNNLPPVTHVQEVSRIESEQFSEPFNIHSIPETATTFITANSGTEIVAVLAIEETPTSLKIVHQSFKYSQAHGLSELLGYTTEMAKQKNLATLEAVTDNSSLDQNVFAQHGFIRKDVIEPNVTYLYKKQRVLKQELKTLLASGADPRISYDPESDSFENIAEENRIFEIWDSGSTLWTLDT